MMASKHVFVCSHCKNVSHHGIILTKVKLKEIHLSLHLSLHLWLYWGESCVSLHSSESGLGLTLKYGGLSDTSALLRV